MNSESLSSDSDNSDADNSDPSQIPTMVTVENLQNHLPVEADRVEALVEGSPEVSYGQSQKFSPISHDDCVIDRNPSINVSVVSNPIDQIHG